MDAVRPGDLVVKRLRQRLADERRMGLVLAIGPVRGEALVLWSEEGRAPVITWHVQDALSHACQALRPYGPALSMALE